MKKLLTKPNKCILCESNLNTSKPYLGIGGESLIVSGAWIFLQSGAPENSPVGGLAVSLEMDRRLVHGA
jgi:hypothetical protein